MLVLKYSIDFREYRDVMKKIEDVPGVVGVAPFVINPMMVTHGERTATGVLLKGVDPRADAQGARSPEARRRGQPRRAAARPGAEPPERAERLPCATAQRRRARAPRTIDRDARNRLAPAARCAREVDEEMRRVDAGAARRRCARSSPEAARALPQVGPATHRRPRGDVTPTGGYRSQLPTTTTSPTRVDPDPCKSPEQVAKMPGIVVGRTLAKQLDVGLGDCVQVTSPQIGMSFGAGARAPIAKSFRVIAVFEAGFDQYDSKLVYTDLYEAQAFYEYGDSVTGIEMKVDDIDRAHADRRRHRRAARQRHLPHDGLARSSTTASSRPCSSSRSA